MENENDRSNGPPWRIIIMCTISTLASALTYIFPFSYTPHLMVHFGIPNDSRGYYVGLLGASTFLGNIPGGFILGRLSDHIGRRPVMLLMLAVMVILNTGFGFANSFAVAFVLRIATGAVCSVAVVARASIYEASPPEHQSLGLAMVNAAFGIGFIFGVFVGGLLANPLEQYASLSIDNHFLRVCPFALPALVISGLITLILLCNALFYEETRIRNNIHSHKHKEHLLNNSNITQEKEHTETFENPVKWQFSQENIGLFTEEMKLQNKHSSLPNIHRKTRNGAANKPWKSILKIAEQTSNVNVTAMFSSIGNININWQRSETSIITQEENIDNRGNHTQRICDSAMLHLLRNPTYIKSLAVFCIFGIGMMIMEEGFVLYCTETPLDGLGFSPKEISIIGAINSAAMVPVILVASILERKLGIIRMHLYMLVLSLLSVLLLPFVRFLYHKPILLWTTLIGVSLPYRFCLLCCITCQNMFINNSVPPDRSGAANGIAESVVNLFRAGGTALGSSIFQWTVAHFYNYPLDVNLAFQTCGLFFIFTALMVFFLPVSIEQASSNCDCNIT